jgi:hypothetical protein
MKEYKVLTQKDRFFGNKFDPVKIEQALNSYAGEGWSLRVGATAEFPGWGGKREELVLILERDKQDEP